MSASPLIAVATHHASIADLLADAEFRSLANREGFLIELRLDYFNDLSEATLAQALDVFAPNVLATFRRSDEGGQNPGATDIQRLHYLQLAADRGVTFIDIEARTPRPNFNKRGAKLILSHHDFAGVPTDLELIRIAIAEQDDVDFVKIAVTPKTIFQTQPLIEMLRAHGEHSILLAMGEPGLWTRVLAGKFGSPLTYARGENAPGTAPGQLTWRQLDELYRFHEILPDWPVYGVIGNPISHSLSPLLHNSALRELKLPGVYLPFKVEGNPAEFILLFQPLGMRGLSVTIPHKLEVIGCCTVIDELAKAIAAVNTIKCQGVIIFGTNTDAQAAADSLEAVLGSVRDKNIVILGAGGAARAVAFGVKARGANVFILNRTYDRAVALAADLHAPAITSETLSQHKVDAIVNTTSVGMSPNIGESPLSESQIPKSCVVFDTVYNPRRTRLLELAEARGCRTIEGISMFIAQGVRQFELWTGQTVTPELRELLTQTVLATL